MDNTMVEVKYNGKTYTIPSENDREIFRILNSVNDDLLTQKGVTDFNGFSFYIKDYQRGYRWGEEEIKYLLDDIAQFDGNGKYCMQPLVVREVKNNADLKGYTIDDNSTKEKSAVPVIGKHVYELVDGQQRLTTIYLIMQKLGIEEPSYKIYYEMLRSLDKKFIEKANAIIDFYFEDKVKNKHKKNREQAKIDLKEDIYNKLDDLVFIWYELKENDTTANEKFSQINKGKIELTNAELFKAMLLNLSPKATAEDKTASEKIAFEWDKIEHGLNDDVFWFFISNNSDERNTRIDYILELYAKKLEKGGYNKKNYSDKKDRYSYNVVRDYIEEVKKGSKVLWEEVVKVWEEIVAVYDKLYSWYCDNEIYNNIGFLVACENKGRSACVQPVVELYLACYNKTLSQVRKEVTKKVAEKLLPKADPENKGKSKEQFVDDFIGKMSYEDKSKTSDLRNFLLYSNIYYVQYYNKNLGGTPERFSFKDYYKVKSWDIEHINPQNPPEALEEAAKIKGDEIDIEDNKKFLLRWLREKTTDDRQKKEIDNLLNTKERGKIDLSAVSDKIKNLWKDCCVNSGDKGNAISNLVLLDSETNRGYHNAMFNAKREIIKRRERQGVFFLPSTRNVFLKYYSNNPERFICWEEKDAADYEQFLKSVVDHLVESK